MKTARSSVLGSMLLAALLGQPELSAGTDGPNSDSKYEPAANFKVQRARFRDVGDKEWSYGTLSGVVIGSVTGRQRFIDELGQQWDECEIAVDEPQQSSGESPAPSPVAAETTTDEPKGRVIDLSNEPPKVGDRFLCGGCKKWHTIKDPFDELILATVPGYAKKIIRPEAEPATTG